MVQHTDIPAIRREHLSNGEMLPQWHDAAVLVDAGSLQIFRSLTRSNTQLTEADLCARPALRGRRDQRAQISRTMSSDVGGLA